MSAAGTVLANGDESSASDNSNTAKMDDAYESSSDSEQEDEGEDITSKAVAANFSTEDFAREKKIEKRWRVASTATESGIEQSWVLVLIPRTKAGFVKATLEFDGSRKSFSPGWYLDVRCSLTLKNLANAEENIVKEEVFRFSKKEPSHSWEEFVASEIILKEKQDGFVDAKGEPHFTFEVQIKRENGCSGAYRAGYMHDSFKATGFCGLKNQGATCYLNSLLQALYWIAPFRASVYRLPTEKDEPNSSIPLALQRLFYRLQFGSSPVSTTELTHSFGWGTKDVFTQHDVQELNRVLQDKIEEKMKGTTEEGQVAKLFRGKMVSYIKCLKVDYESKREEEFYDVSLVVKGCKTVYDSFDKYTETELLNGDNQYQAEGHGKQDAEMGVRFIQFPPVLHLQLKRFDFDLNTLNNYKVHQRYEFPRELDIRKYVDANSPFRDEPAVYILQGVMVHSGTAGGGHYYAYFRPTSRKRWYKFNDMRVTKATSEEAFDGNFGTGAIGGASKSPRMFSSISGGGGGGVDSVTSAYMLQYVRKDHFEACVAPVPASVIPPHIAHRFQEEEEERARRKEEKRDAHLYTFVKVFDDKDLAEHRHFDLMDFERVRPDRVFRVLKTSTIQDLTAEHLIQSYNVDDPAKLRLRLFTRRKNGTIRASKLVEDELVTIVSTQNKENASDACRFLVEKSDRTAPPYFDPAVDTECQVFFKYYDPVAKRLQFVTRVKMSKEATLLSVESMLRQKAGIAADEKLLYWEEVRIESLRIDPCDPSETLRQLELGNGDIVVFQTLIPGTLTSKADLCADTPLSNAGESINPIDMNVPLVRQYYKFLLESISVRFKRLDSYETDDGITIMCIKSNNYEQVQQLVARHLPDGMCADPHMLQFTGQSSFSLKPVWNGPFISTATVTLSRMLRSQYGDRVMDTIYYEVLPYTLEDMKRKSPIETKVFDLQQNLLYSGVVVVDKEATFADLTTEARKHCQPPIAEDQELRVIQVSYHKVQRVLKPTDAVSTVLSRSAVVIEFVTPEEASLEKTDRIGACVHAEHDYFLTPFGVPFIFVFHKKEKVAAIRERLGVRLAIGAEELAKWKFGTAVGGYATSFKELEDSDHVDASKWTDATYFAMIHPNRRTRARYHHKEEGVKFHEVVAPEAASK